MILYQHQLDILKEDPLKTGLFLGTGSGKTSTALALARKRTLVICPKTQKQDKNWEREYKRMGEHGHPIPDSLTIISKEEFRRDWQDLPAFNTVIVDEAHTCLGVLPETRQRNKMPIPKTSQLFEALDMYLQKTKPERLYLCTATIGKSPMTIWGAAKLLGKNWDFFRFRDTFYFQLPRPGRPIYIVRQDYALKDRLAENVRKLGYVGRLQDWFDVPEQTFQTKFLELTTEQKEAIKEATREFPEPMTLIGKKHQIENGLLVGNEYSSEKNFKNAKIEKLKELAFEFDKMIVFARYTAQIDLIARELGKETKVLIMDGRTKDKGAIINDAKNTNGRCILIVQSSISAGWELPQFSVMVFASMTNSYTDREQGEGRILRSNAIKKNLYIDLVVKGGIDEAVYNSIKSKKDFNERIYAETL